MQGPADKRSRAVIDDDVVVVLRDGNNDDVDAALEAESLAVVMQLQRIYCCNELYNQLVHLLGRPTTQEERDAYYDDVQQLIALYERTAAAYDRAHPTGTATADAAAREAYMLAMLYNAVNNNSSSSDGGGERAADEPHKDGDDKDGGDAVSMAQLRLLYATLEATLQPTHVTTALTLGALELAEQARRNADAALRREVQEQQQRQQQQRYGNASGGAANSLRTAPEVRRAAMKASPEELFRMAQLVRSGLADDADLLQLRTENDDDDDNGDGDDVELNEEEPTFLRRVGLPSLRRRINYRALLPSQQLREAQTPQQRQLLKERLAQRQERDEATMTSLERTAAMQVRINADRRMIAKQARWEQEHGGEGDDVFAADAARGTRQSQQQHSDAHNSSNNTTTNAAAAIVEADRQGAGLLLHSELDAPMEEGGFRPGELPARLPPWLRHGSGSGSAAHVRFGPPPPPSRRLPHHHHQQQQQGGSSAYESLQEQRRQLPIYAKREALLQHIDAHSVTILVGETGSGKTTQIPQYLAEHGYTRHGVVCCTQPRRVAAETLALRVSEEYGCRLGEEVGYTVRFRDVTSSLTRIKYVTDGMLLREALLDDGFARYSVIILDEAHERSINTDLLFAIVRNALHKHPSLKVLITSATLETGKFCAYFGVAAPFVIEGRTFPVETYYLAEPTNDYVRTALQTVMQVHLTEPPGDVLVFLTGQEEIELAGEQLYDWLQQLRRHVDTPLPDMLVLPLTATMPQEVQSRVFETTPPGTRKVVLATNVAETSITIADLYFVIDSGFCKQSIFDPARGIEQLRITPISQAQAKQRAGRAGRVGPGKCFRMYTEAQYADEMTPETVPDIMRANLFHVTLQLKAMGIDLVHLDLLDRPSVAAMVAALEKLRYLEALDDDGLLTPLGGRMAQLSIDPSQSKTLLTAVDMGCSEPVLTIVSMLAVQKRGVFYRPRDRQEAADAARRQFAQPEGDQLTLMAVYDAWVHHGMSEEWCARNFLKHRMLVEARDTREQLREMLTQRHRHISHAHDDDVTQVRRALTAGYFFHAARRVDAHARSYVVLADRREVYVHPSSVLVDEPPKYVLYDDLRMTSREYMTELLAIEPRWLVELAPAFFTRPSKSGRRLTRAQEAERLTPILRAWETGSSWRISKLRKQQRR